MRTESLITCLALKQQTQWHPPVQTPAAKTLSAVPWAVASGCCFLNHAGLGNLNIQLASEFQRDTLAIQTFSLGGQTTFS